MTRGVRNLIAGSVMLTALVLLAVVGMRGRRSNFTAPEPLKPGLFAIKAGFVYIYGARAGANVVLFDSGQDPEGHALLALLPELHASPGDVHDVFLTHGHGDHISGVPLLSQARVWLGEGDVDLAAGRAAPESFMARVFAVLSPPPAVHATQALTTDESVDVGGNLMVRCIPMPGHTPGSYAYLFDGVLFVGDTMNAEAGRLVPTTGMFNPRPEENRKSVQHLKEALADVTIDRVCTSHGGCTAAGDGSQQLQEFIRSLGSET